MQEESSNYPLDKKVRTYLLLAEGHSHSKVANLIGTSESYVRKIAKEYVDKGLLERVVEGRGKPVLYQKKEEVRTTHKPVLETIMLPVKFGAVFKMSRKPVLLLKNYDIYGKAEEKTQMYYVQFGRHKAQIYLYNGFQGSTVEERIISGRKIILGIAEKMSKKYEMTLSLIRFFDGIEWVDIDTERGIATANGMGLKKGGSLEVAGAIHKFADASHPENFQINPLPRGDLTKATQHAAIRERLYSGEYDRIFEKLLDSNVRFADNLDLHLTTLQDISAGVKGLTEAVRKLEAKL